MSLFSAFQISASGLAVQRKRIDVISENLANVSSTRTPEGGPYRKKNVVISSAPISFEQSMETFLKPQDVQGAKVVGIEKSNEPPRLIFDPGHPDADASGNVALPNVNAMEEMIDMMTASKSYEANITVFNAAKTMMLRTLDIGGV